MKRKEFSGQKMLLVLFFTIIIFSIGIYVGSYGTEQKLANLDQMYNDLRIETQETELEYEIAQSSLCNQKDFSTITESLDEWGLKLDYMERNMGKEDPAVLNMKRFYYILELKHWLLAKKQLENCEIPKDVDSSIILYFYSNLGDCDTCDRQGLVLSHLKEKYNNIKIYSFDINYDSSALKTLKEKYGVTDEIPTLIINEKYHAGFLDVNSLEEYIVAENLS